MVSIDSIDSIYFLGVTAGYDVTVTPASEHRKITNCGIYKLKLKERTVFDPRLLNLHL